ncbi:glutathione S-transferase omega-1 [Elysia marginata]|uniref:Glutathione S-transferase omega n=1 Tax=Elysia marginata TaxID=1093978 RepID=A0AAV4FE07_9GAST|nr:glutathione S-transferase omega-1 [Elysia marginata]
MTQKAYTQGSTFPPTKPDVLRIYSMRFCPYSHRARLVLNHKKIPFEVVNINLKSKPDWYLAINPLGTVPALQIDDKVITDSVAAAEWLDDVYTESRLQPSDPYRRALDRVLLEYISKFYGSFRDALKSTDPTTLQTNIEETKKHLQFYEEKLKARGEGPFFGGSKPCMFDLLFWPMVERFPVLAVMKESPTANIDADKFPTFTAWVQAMKELPELKATGFDTDSYVAFFRGYLKETPDYNLFLKE